MMEANSPPLAAILIGLLWGATNPFMGKGAEGMTDEKTFVAQMWFLMTRWQVLSFLIPSMFSHT